MDDHLEQYPLTAAWVNMHIHTHIHTHICIHICKHTYTHIHTYIHICIHTNIHICTIYTHIHICIYRTIALISHTSKVMLKILQARLQQYVNRELPDVQAGFRKDRGTSDQIANTRSIFKKSKSVPEKHLLLLYWLHWILWLCGSQQTGKFFKRWEYQATWLASWEICLQVRKQQLELDMEQWTGSK